MTKKHISTALKEDTRLFFCIYVQNVLSVTPLCRLVHIRANQGDAGVEVMCLNVPVMLKGSQEVTHLHAHKPLSDPLWQSGISSLQEVFFYVEPARHKTALFSTLVKALTSNMTPLQPHIVHAVLCCVLNIDWNSRTKMEDTWKGAWGS